jgi:hypothetical protein
MIHVTYCKYWIPVPRLREDKLHGNDKKDQNSTFYETVNELRPGVMTIMGYRRPG